jgi:ergothioneine biosynthesis protein EgtC
MCRWLTYRGDPIYLEELLFTPRHSLIEQSLHARKAAVTTNGDGFGVGWYAERDLPGTYRDILPAWNDPNLRSIAHQIRSGLFLAHVRASTGTATSRANCHPFANGRWLFMHNGQIGGYAKLRRRLEALIPDALYEQRLGTTDSEAIFYLMLKHGLDRDPLPAIAAAIRDVRRLMLEVGIAEAFRMTASLTDGRAVYAIRYSSDAEPPSLYWHTDAGRLTIVSEPLDEHPQKWRLVPPGHVLVAGEAGDVALTALAA